MAPASRPLEPAPSPGVTLFYDGACPLCAREARHYRKADGAGRLAFVDIAGHDFDAAAHGLDAKAVQASLHARDAAGRVHTGIDAFAVVWRQLPRYRHLAPLMRVPGLRQVLQLGYAAFAKVRPHLPGRRCPAPAR